jgi:hypothetical protein
VTSTPDGHLCLHKDNGMVTDVFTKGAVANLHGDTSASATCAIPPPAPPRAPRRSRSM